MHRKWFRRYHPAFTMIEMLFSLSITLFILMNCSMFYKALKEPFFSKEIDAAVENGIATLSYELCTGYNFTYGDTLEFYNEKEELCCVSLNDGRLVITPGQNIICHNLENVYFYNDNGLIYMEYQYQGQKRTSLIGSDYGDYEDKE